MPSGRIGPKGKLTPILHGVDRESAGSGEQAASSGGPDSSSMGSSALVPCTAENVGGRSSSSSSHIVSSSADVQSHSTHDDNVTASHVPYLGHKFSINRLSEQASELMLAYWQFESSKSYDSHFRKWASWCDEQGCDPVSCPVSEIVKFFLLLCMERVTNLGLLTVFDWQFHQCTIGWMALRLVNILWWQTAERGILR